MRTIEVNEHTPEITFEAPEGIWSGVLYNVLHKDTEDAYGPMTLVRLIFRADVPTMNDKTVLVGKDLPPDSPKMHTFLKRWLGSEFLRQYEQGGLDLKELVGTPADLEIQHIHNAGYRTPFRNLVGAYPLGSMKRQSMDPAATWGTKCRRRSENGVSMAV